MWFPPLVPSSGDAPTNRKRRRSKDDNGRGDLSVDDDDAPPHSSLSALANEMTFVKIDSEQAELAAIRRYAALKSYVRDRDRSEKLNEFIITNARGGKWCYFSELG